MKWCEIQQDPNSASIMSNMNSVSNVRAMKLDISVIIPTFNEEKFIGKCLNSILEQDYSKQKIEIIVVDGMSTDATCAIVERYVQKYSNIYLIHNESRVTSIALNIGIGHARGEIIVRMDGHAEAPPNYISESVKCLVKKKPDVVGCLMEIIGMGYWGQRIAIALSSPFGVGNARYRVSKAEVCGEPGWLGTFWRKTIIDIGGFDHSFQCNEDDELSYRMLYDGFNLYIPSEVSCKYFCRTRLSGLWQQYYKFGFWKVAVIAKLGKIPSIRHIIPALFLSTLFVLTIGGIFSSLLLKTLLLGLIAYVSFLVVGSWKASKGKNIPCFLTIIPAFLVLHFSYGAGFLNGFFSWLIIKLKMAKKLIHFTNIKQLFRPALQNKVSAFVIYFFDASYDFSRYFVYSGNLYGINSGREKLEALISMNAHKIEKGLTLKKQPRKNFQIAHIIRLVRLLEKYSQKGYCQDIPFLSAYSALVKYKEHSGAELEKYSLRTAQILDAFLNNYQKMKKKGIQGGTRTYHYSSTAAKNKTIDYDFFVKSRHSVRTFTDRPVFREVLDRAVERARWTPSVCNRQAWRVHVFESENLKKKALSNQNGNDGFGDSADKILVITCDMRCFFTSRERNQCFIDGGMFSMSLIYALHAAGVASCALNLSTYSFQDINLHRTLKIPMYEAPIMMMAIGYPPDKLEVTFSGRFPVEKLITYRDS